MSMTAALATQVPRRPAVKRKKTALMAQTFRPASPERLDKHVKHIVSAKLNGGPSDEELYGNMNSDTSSTGADGALPSAAKGGPGNRSQPWMSRRSIIPAQHCARVSRTSLRYLIAWRRFARHGHPSGIGS